VFGFGVGLQATKTEHPIKPNSVVAHPAARNRTAPVLAQEGPSREAPRTCSQNPYLFLLRSSLESQISIYPLMRRGRACEQRVWSADERQACRRGRAWRARLRVAAPAASAADGAGTGGECELSALGGSAARCKCSEDGQRALLVIKSGTNPL